MLAWPSLRRETGLRLASAWSAGRLFFAVLFVCVFFLFCFVRWFRLCSYCARHLNRLPVVRCCCDLLLLVSTWYLLLTLVHFDVFLFGSETIDFSTFSRYAVLSRSTRHAVLQQPEDVDGRVATITASHFSRPNRNCQGALGKQTRRLPKPAPQTRQGEHSLWGVTATTSSSSAVATSTSVA